MHLSAALFPLAIPVDSVPSVDSLLILASTNLPLFIQAALPLTSLPTQLLFPNSINDEPSLGVFEDHVPRFSERFVLLLCVDVLRVVLFVADFACVLG